VKRGIGIGDLGLGKRDWGLGNGNWGKGIRGLIAIGKGKGIGRLVCGRRVVILCRD
jgi:hypothetical protein